MPGSAKSPKTPEQVFDALPPGVRELFDAMTPQERADALKMLTNIENAKFPGEVYSEVVRPLPRKLYEAVPYALRAAFAPTFEKAQERGYVPTDAQFKDVLGTVEGAINKLYEDADFRKLTPNEAVDRVKATIIKTFAKTVEEGKANKGWKGEWTNPEYSKELEEILDNPNIQKTLQGFHLKASQKAMTLKGVPEKVPEPVKEKMSGVFLPPSVTLADDSSLPAPVIAPWVLKAQSFIG